MDKPRADTPESQIGLAISTLTPLEGWQPPAVSRAPVVTQVQPLRETWTLASRFIEHLPVVSAAPVASTTASTSKTVFDERMDNRLTGPLSAVGSFQRPLSPACGKKNGSRSHHVAGGSPHKDDGARPPPPVSIKEARARFEAIAGRRKTSVTGSSNGRTHKGAEPAHRPSALPRRASLGGSGAGATSYLARPPPPR